MEWYLYNFLFHSLPLFKCEVELFQMCPIKLAVPALHLRVCLGGFTLAFPALFSCFKYAASLLNKYNIFLTFLIFFYFLR